MEHDFEVCERGYIVVVPSFEVNREKGLLGLLGFSFLPSQVYIIIRIQQKSEGV